MLKQKMICTACGVEMNHHATKVDYTIDDPALLDPDFGGVVEEAYTCPHCGHIELRQA